MVRFELISLKAPIYTNYLLNEPKRTFDYSKQERIKKGHGHLCVVDFILYNVGAAKVSIFHEFILNDDI